MKLRILTLLIKEEYRAKLQPVSWDEVGPRVMVPQWQEAVKKHEEALRTISLAHLPEVAKNGFALSMDEGDAEARLQRCRWILGAALGLRLHQDGWKVEAPPGDTIHLRRSGEDVIPFEMVHRAAAGELAEADWSAAVSSWGLRAEPLVGPAGVPR